MRMLSALTLSVLFALPAAAQEQVPGESSAAVNFEVETELFRRDDFVYDLAFTVFDTGRLGVRFTADAAVNAEGELASESELTWPETFTQGWLGQAGGGHLFVEALFNADIEAFADGTWDIPGTYDPTLNITYELWALSEEGPMSWEVEKFFDSLLLPGAETESTSIAINADTILAPIFSYNVPAFTINTEDDLNGPVDPNAFWLEIDIDLVVRPDVTLELSGTSISTGGRAVDSADGTVVIPARNANDGTMQFSSIWAGSVAATFDVIAGLEFVDFQGGYGGFDVDGEDTIGSILEAFTTFTFRVGQETADVRSKNTSYDHDLPAIDTDRASLDFGAVLVDNEAQLNLTVEDLGAIDLEGDVIVEGSGFSISRTDLDIPGNDEGSITVTFRPNESGRATGELTIMSNDPVNHTVAIPLSGQGYEEGDDTANPDTGNGGPGGEAGIRGCGCSSAPTGSLAWLGLIPAMGFVLRRRR